MTKPPRQKKSGSRTVPKVPEALKIIGEESQRNGTDSRQIDLTITAYRKARKKKRAG